MQCRVFGTTYNPNGVRMGTRILHERLKGEQVASYYPPRIGTIKQLRALYPEWTVIDEKEEDWVEHLTIARSRGKENPKKKRTAAGMDIIREYLQKKQNTDSWQNRRSSARADDSPLRCARNTKLPRQRARWKTQSCKDTVLQTYMHIGRWTSVGRDTPSIVSSASLSNSQLRRTALSRSPTPLLP